MPLESMVPMAAEPPGVELTDQETALFEEPVTEAENRKAEPARTLAAEGETETVTAPPGGGGF